MSQFEPIQISPSMWWTKPEFNMAVPQNTMVPQQFCPEGQWPTETGCRELSGASVPKWLYEGAVGLGAVDPATLADGAALGGVLVGIGVRGLLGYFIGKWTGASKGWTAAGAAILGVPGTAASVYFTKKDRVKSNRRRGVRKNASRHVGKITQALVNEWLEDGVPSLEEWGSIDTSLIPTAAYMRKASVMGLKPSERSAFKGEFFDALNFAVHTINSKTRRNAKRRTKRKSRPVCGNPSKNQKIAERYWRQAKAAWDKSEDPGDYWERESSRLAELATEYDDNWREAYQGSRKSER